MRIIINIVVSAVILAVGFVGLRLFGQRPEVPTQNQKGQDEAVAVVTAKVSAYAQPFQLETDGEAVTYRVVTVGAEVEGRIVRKTTVARGGTYVQQGDVLFEIDPTNYQLAIDRLHAELAQAEEELAAVAVDLENTTSLIALADEDWQLQKNQLARMKELMARRTANETEVENAMKAELMARNSLQSLQNQKNALEQQQKTRQAARELVATQLRRAEVDLGRCVVRSPLEGRVVDDVVEEGDYIKSGELLVHISDGSKMEIKCQLRSEELAWVWQQKETQAENDTSHSPTDPLNLPPVPCEVAYEFQGVETIWDGYIARLEGTGIDRDTRTFPCRVLVEEPRKPRFNDSPGGRPAVAPPALLSGMYVTVRIPVESPVPLLSMPTEAVRPGGQIWVNEGNQLRIVQVALAHVDDEMALIRQLDSGLTDGDRVIVSPLPSVQNGMTVSEAADKAESTEVAQ